MRRIILNGFPRCDKIIICFQKILLNAAYDLERKKTWLCKQKDTEKEEKMLTNQIDSKSGISLFDEGIF